MNNGEVLKTVDFRDDIEIFSEDYYTLEREVIKYLDEFGPADTATLSEALSVAFLPIVLNQMIKDGMIEWSELAEAWITTD